MCQFKVWYRLPFDNHAYGVELPRDTWRGAKDYNEAESLAAMYRSYHYTPVRIEPMRTVKS